MVHNENNRKRGERLDRFDYGKLRERIRDKQATQTDRANALNLSTKTISLKMSGKISWKQEEIFKLLQFLNIPNEQVSDYFFTLKVLN